MILLKFRNVLEMSVTIQITVEQLFKVSGCELYLRRKNDNIISVYTIPDVDGYNENKIINAKKVVLTT